MRFYKVTGRLTDQTKRVWAGSETDAAKARKTLRELGVSNANIETLTVEVPTSKRDLLNFLNSLET